MKPQAISVRIGRVVWHGEGRIPAAVLEQAIGAAIAARVNSTLAPPRPGRIEQVASQVADTVAGQWTHSAGASQ